MRIVSLIPAVAVVALLATGAVRAQNWIEYSNQMDHFGVNFPGQPTVTPFDFMSEYGATLKGRKYLSTYNGDNYSVTVIDYKDAISLTDKRGSIAFAAMTARQRGKVTYDAYQEIDRIPGMQLQVTEANTRRIYIGFNFWADRLYILEAEVKADTPPPEGFRASLTVLDDNGQSIRLGDDGQPARRGGAPAGGAAAGGAAAGGGGGGRGAAGGGGGGRGAGGGAPAGGGAN